MTLCEGEQLPPRHISTYKRARKLPGVVKLIIITRGRAELAEYVWFRAGKSAKSFDIDGSCMLRNLALGARDFVNRLTGRHLALLPNTPCIRSTIF